MTFISLIAALGTIFAAGYGALNLIARKPPRFNLPEQFALSWLFGTGMVSLLIWLFGFFARGALLPCIVTVVCLFLAWLSWKQIPWPQIPKTVGPVKFILTAILLIEIAIVFYLSFVRTLGWDGLLNWEIKARYAFANGGVLPAGYLADRGRAFSHPEYPLAIPFTQLWLYFWLGQANQFWAKIIFPMFYASGSILLAALAFRFTRRISLALVGGISLFFIPQISIGDSSAIIGYVDFPLSVFYLATIGLLVGAAEKNSDNCFYSYAACLALLPWVKREGVILWVVAAACGVFVILRTKKSPSSFLVLLPGLLIICAWHFYLSAMQAPQAADFLPINLDSFTTNLYRILPLLSALLAEFHNLPVWSLFWFVVAVGILRMLPRMRDFRVALLLAALIAPVVLYLLIYVFSNWPNYLEHVGLSISRLLMHVAPLGFLVTILAVSGEKGSEQVRQRRTVACATPGSERTAVVELA